MLLLDLLGWLLEEVLSVGIRQLLLVVQEAVARGEEALGMWLGLEDVQLLVLPKVLGVVALSLGRVALLAGKSTLLEHV